MVSAALPLSGGEELDLMKVLDCVSHTLAGVRIRAEPEVQHLEGEVVVHLNSVVALKIDIDED